MHKLDLKSWSQLFAEECGDTEEGIKKQIDRENTLKRGILKSIIKWRKIVDEIEGSCTGSSRSENEYRLRFYYQHQYNELLQTELEDLKAQRKTANTEKKVVFKDFDIEMSIPELRTKIRELQREKCSLNSLITMHERQLDKESMDFHKTRELCDVILNDVLLQQKSRMENQEQIDKVYFMKIRKNLHNIVYGKDSFSTSCLGLAKSRSNVSSRHLVTSKSRLQSNSKVSIKSGVKGNRSSVTNRLGSAKGQDSFIPVRNSVSRNNYSEDSKAISDTTKEKRRGMNTLRKAFNTLKTLSAFTSMKEKSTLIKNDKEEKLAPDDIIGMDEKDSTEKSTLLNIPRKLSPISKSTSSGPSFLQERQAHRKVNRKPKPSHLPSMKANKNDKKEKSVEPKKSKELSFDT